MCDSCFGLGVTVTHQQRIFRQRVARTILAKLTRRGESLFEVAARMKSKAGIGDLSDVAISPQRIRLQLAKANMLTSVFPDGLIRRTAREVLREHIAEQEAR
jgi:hypothetical protein